VHAVHHRSTPLATLLLGALLLAPLSAPRAQLASGDPLGDPMEAGPEADLEGPDDDWELASAEPEYETEVRARAPARRPVEDAPGFVETIDGSRSTAEVTTVGELLSAAPGVRVQRLGGLDDFATVSVRGASAQQVLVLLDGVPLSSAHLQQVDVNAVAPDLLDRLEVYRSGAPLWLGLAPMGGVVNLVTRPFARRDEDVSVLASASFGSFLTRKVTVSAALPLMLEPAWDLLVGGTYRGTEGDFAFHDDRGTPLNPADDRTAARRNNVSNGGDLLVRTRFEPAPNLELSAQEALQVNRRGVPGLGQHQSATARFEHVRSLTQLGLTARAWPWATTDLHLLAHADVLRDRFDDPDGDIGIGARDVRNRGDAFGGRARLSIFAGTALELETALEARYEQFLGRNARDPASPEASAQRVTLAPAAQLGLHLVDDRLLLAPGARLEHVLSRFDGGLPFVTSPLAPAPERSDTVWAAQLGARYRLLEGRGGGPRLTLHGSVMRGGRLPTFVEMFGDTGAVIGNPGLTPESVLGGDLGATLQLDSSPWHGRLTVAAFAYRYDDLIQYVQNSQRVARPENVGAARIDGLEVAAGLDAGRWLTLYLTYTLTDALDASELAGQSGRPLPGRPTHDLYVSITGRVWQLELEYELDLESENTLDRAGYRVVPERVFHGLAARFSPNAHWTLAIEVDNLTDRRVEEVPLRPAAPGTNPTSSQAVADYLGFPLPGRTVYATVRWAY
jgi:vitamin B12 transporter